MSQVFTIGHSNHQSSTFMALLSVNCITAVADVRTSPFSRFNPQFNRETLSKSLWSSGIKYVFLGVELGARSDDPACYERGKVKYNRLAETALFQQGIERVIDGARSHRVALMCAEKEPLDCHRAILVARELDERGMDVRHILADGSTESHSHAMKRLMDLLSLPEQDMFKSQRQILDEAYAIRAEQIAYDRDAPDGSRTDSDKGEAP